MDYSLWVHKESDTTERLSVHARARTHTHTHTHTQNSVGFPGGAVVKNPPASEGDTGDLVSTLGSGRSPGGGNGTYSCLENFMDRGAWQATVHGTAKSWT